jgi:hypothetical protein
LKNNINSNHFEPSEQLVYEKIIDFLDEIGLSYELVEINESSFLPGLFISYGVLQIDLVQLIHIGDILHEAGHIAITPPAKRNTIFGSLKDEQHAAAHEMAVLAWSYAACLKIGIAPDVVFHVDGYRGESQSLIYNFENGQYIGVPILEWYGMTQKRSIEDLSASDSAFCYPGMLNWLNTVNK